MGNSGRSSTGCGLCRKRKIKCDEGRPGCRKCAQIRKPCPGYPFSIELHLRQEPAPQVQLTVPVQQTVPIQHTVPVQQITPTPQLSYFPRHASLPSQPSTPFERPPSARPLSTPPRFSPGIQFQSDRTHPYAPRATSILAVKDESPEQDPEAQLLNVPQYRSKSISPPPKYDVEHQATCFFLNLFSFQASKLYGIPVLDFLPDMLGNATNHIAIQHASKAVSRMTLADRYSGCDHRLQSSDEYAKALKSVANTISHVDEAITDEAITAVWLLGLYEAINSVLSHGRETKNRNLDEEWRHHIAHMRGAMRLLRLRGQKQFENPRSEKIFRIFKAAIQMRLFVLNSVTSSDFDYLEVDVYKDEHEFVPSETANRASAFFRKAARHMETSKYALHKFELQPDSQDLAAEIDQLLYEGECLDAGMLRWSKSEPGWDMMPVQGNTQGTMWALYPFHAQYYFYSFWVFLYWLRFLIGRIKLYETLIKIVKIKQRSAFRAGVDSNRLTHFDKKINGFIHIIQKTADDLIGLTAYALGDVSNTGHFFSTPSGLNPGGGWHEVNVVAAMQLVIPFKVLQRSPYALPEQKGAIDLAIIHLADGFRRQPINPDLLR